MSIRRLRYVLFFVGLAIALLMALRSQVHRDQFFLLVLGWELVENGRLFPFGPHISGGGLYPGSLSEKRRRVSEVRSPSSPGRRNASPGLANANEKARRQAPRIMAKPLPEVLAPVPPPSDPAAEGDGAGEITQGGTGESDS